VANISDTFRSNLQSSHFIAGRQYGVAETVLKLLVAMAGEEDLEQLISALEE
jgi:hypothetical protein